ncbi:GTPase-associated system all-helical protein GASH [Brevundimonas sp.]|uniref:GTPase-associated system all-helical protein GASH n=1 Tax=Brevundimonas sp. TaxID=1871086 RepID=UPI0028A01EE6|nr:GTPase-associated system all-helical protein GASH [Brevundimonas sp.]
MRESTLQRFLNNGLVNVQGDDDKLARLSKAADDLAGGLKANPSKALSYALVAFDPNAPEDDPVVQEALEALQKQWNTYRNTFSTTPVQVIRAMLLDALITAAEQDDRVGVCFVATARNALPLFRGGSERDLWVDAVNSVESRVDARAESEWATPDSITVAPLAYVPPELGAPQISRGKAPKAALLAEMRQAAGPHVHDPERGDIATDGNPHWPQNSPSHWAWDFSRIAAGSIASAIDETVAKIEVSQPDLAEPFNAMAEAVSDHVNATLAAVSGATAGLQRRTQLLWWREALYSPSARESYRIPPVSVAAAQMALDLFSAVPLFSPASVVAFLSETVRRLDGTETSERRPISDLVAEAQQHEGLAPLRTAASEMTAEPVGRGPLLALIGHGAVADVSEKAQFQRLTGVPADAELDSVSWAEWLFRELQACKAASDGSPPKRRGGKKG